jgi:hypothetical protein
MKNSKITTTGNFDSPEIRFERNSRLSISGNSISISPEASYDPLINWISSYKGESLHIEIDLNFVNCGSVKKILQTIKTVDKNEHIKTKQILWYYNDEEQEELGEMLSSMTTSSKFRLTYKASR